MMDFHPRPVKTTHRRIESTTGPATASLVRLPKLRPSRPTRGEDIGHVANTETTVYSEPPSVLAPSRASPSVAQAKRPASQWDQPVMGFPRSCGPGHVEMAQIDHRKCRSITLTENQNPADPNRAEPLDTTGPSPDYGLWPTGTNNSIRSGRLPLGCCLEVQRLCGSLLYPCAGGDATTMANTKPEAVSSVSRPFVYTATYFACNHNSIGDSVTPAILPQTLGTFVSLDNSSHENIQPVWPISARQLTTACDPAIVPITKMFTCLIAPACVNSTVLFVITVVCRRSISHTLVRDGEVHTHAAHNKAPQSGSDWSREKKSSKSALAPTLWRGVRSISCERQFGAAIELGSLHFQLSQPLSLAVVVVPALVPQRTVRNRLLLAVNGLVVEVDRRPDPVEQHNRRHVRQQTARRERQLHLRERMQRLHQQLEQERQEVGEKQRDLVARWAQLERIVRTGQPLAEARRILDARLVRHEHRVAGDVFRILDQRILRPHQAPGRVASVHDLLLTARAGQLRDAAVKLQCHLRDGRHEPLVTLAKHYRRPDRDGFQLFWEGGREMFESKRADISEVLL
uniref:Uncharacterized protein n=1 Tax=Anopheles farauti TaxID=69004 RepID=A0A182Q5G8_9DIPT